MTLSRYIPFLLLPLMLAGCGSPNEDELRAWMSEQRMQMRPRVTPIPAPKPFQPESYAESGKMDPFNMEKLTSVLKQDTTRANPASNKLIAPELARRKEALEAYPLDTMVMVGSLIQEGQPVALIQIDKLLYQVRLGSHLGSNYGRVIKITETEVTLREIVQDAVGEWVERPATLQLQEKVK